MNTPGRLQVDEDGGRLRAAGGTLVKVETDEPEGDGDTWTRLRAFFAGPSRFEVFQSDGAPLSDRLQGALGLVAAGATILSGNDGVHVKEVTVVSPLWASDTPLRVAFLTDLHVGSPFVGRDELRAIVDRTNALKPDLVILGGDYTNEDERVPAGCAMPANGTYVPIRDVAAELARLQAPQGRFAVLGNHDNAWAQAETRAALEGAGFAVLSDSATRVRVGDQEVAIVGARDEWTEGSRVADQARDASWDGTPTIVVAHNPTTLNQVAAPAALMLAGHVHGGQVFGAALRRLGSLPVLGGALRALADATGMRALRDFLDGPSGTSVDAQGRVTHVSPGLGTSSLPLRVGDGPEPSISLVDLQGRSRPKPRAGGPA